MVDKKELSRLWELAKEEGDANESAIVKFISDKTDKKLEVYVNSRRQNDWSISVEFINEKGERDFGSDFSIYYMSSFGKEPELKMGCGTIGSYSRHSEPYQIDRMRLMVNLWDSEEELVNLLNSLPHTAVDQAEKLQNQADKEEEELREQQEKARELEIKESIVVGAEFTERCYNTNIDFKITKITQKRIYFFRTKHWTSWRWKYEGDRAIQESAIIEEKETCYISIDDFIDAQKNGIKISNFVKGIDCVSREYLPVTEEKSESSQ